MNIDNFQTKFQGKAVDFDKYAGVQCADGARYWVEDVDGWNMPSAFFRPYEGNGRYGDDGVLDGFYSFKAGHQSIVANRQGKDRAGKEYRIDIINNQNDLQRGDLVFTTGSNQWGHTGIFVGRDGKIPNTFQLFDTNGANPKRPAFWWSNYNNSTFVGALRKVEINRPTPTPPKPKPQPKPPAQRTYTVKRGDTLSGIALKTLNNANRYKEIAKLNGITNPNLILPGQILKLPN